MAEETKSVTPLDGAELETDARLVDALARVASIGARINRQQLGDPDTVTRTLQLVVDGAVSVVPGSCAAIYTFDPVTMSFDAASRIVAGADGPLGNDHAPRSDGMGMRAIRQMRTVLSYDEPDLAIHPAKAAAGARTVACFPLIVADQAAGVLFVHLRQSRRFTRIELLLLENFVNQAAMAIYHASQFVAVHRDLARMEGDLSRLRHAGLLISSRAGLEETLEVILQMALDVTGAQYGIFRLIDEQGEALITRAIAGEGLARPAVEALPTNATSIMGLAAKSRQPLLISDVREEPWSRIYYPLDHSLEMRSELVVPMIGAGGRLEGVLNLESPAVGAFTEQDSQLLQALATQAVVAIQEARLLDALTEMAERLLTQPCDDVLEHLVGLTGELLNTSTSVIWKLEDDVLKVRAAGPGYVRGETMPLVGSLTGEAVLTRKPVVSEDVRSDPRFRRVDAARELGWTRGLILPILAGDDDLAVGAFTVYGTDGAPNYFAASDWDRKVLGILAHYAGLALRNAETQSALRAAQAQRSAAETFAAVGDIAANLLHHVNNKVGTIPVRVEGIEDKCTPALAGDPYLATNLQEIKHSAREAMAAVRENLSYLQSSSLGPVSVASAVHDALRGARLPSLVTVHTSGLEDLSAVGANQRALALAFGNLLENAVEAMRGQGQITIRGAERRRWVEVTVSNDGPPIPAELQERIFELNFSGRGAAAPGKLGFGLWWVKTLMTRLGGSITVESGEDARTSFLLRMPCAGEGI